MKSKKQIIRDAVFKNTNELFLSNKDRIIEGNNNLLNNLVVSEILIFGILAILSLVVSTLNLLTNVYLFSFVVLLIFYLTGYNKAFNNLLFKKIRLLVYIIVSLAFGVYIGAIYNVVLSATMINVIMMCISIVFITPLIQICVVNAITGFIFLYLSYTYKSYNLFYYDMVNFICTYVLTTITAYNVLYLRFELIYEELILSKSLILDDLTNLYNRKELYKILESNFQQEYCSVAMIDVDNFKKINDTHGHLIGDECLKQLSIILKKYHQKYNVTVSRFGGEEFVVTSCAYNKHTFLKILNELRLEIQDLEINAKNIKLNITVSVGVSSLDSEPNDFIQLLSHADIALYKAKSKGKNQVENYLLSTI